MSGLCETVYQALPTPFSAGRPGYKATCYLLLQVWEGLFEKLCDILLDVDSIAGGLHGRGVEKWSRDLVVLH